MPVTDLRDLEVSGMGSIHEANKLEELGRREGRKRWVLNSASKGNIR